MGLIRRNRSGRTTGNTFGGILDHQPKGHPPDETVINQVSLNEQFTVLRGSNRRAVNKRIQLTRELASQIGSKIINMRPRESDG